MESDAQTTCVAVQYTDNEKGVDGQREREWLSSNVVDRNRVSTLMEECKDSSSLSLVCIKLQRIIASFISRQYVQLCQKCLLRTENLGVYILCCCPRTNYEQLWTSLINCMGYRVWKVDTQETIGLV